MFLIKHYDRVFKYYENLLLEIGRHLIYWVCSLYLQGKINDFFYTKFDLDLV